MQKPRERDTKDKIKQKGGGRIQTDARRQLTAKFRKELAQRQRGDGETYEAQAVEQTEEVSEAAFEELIQQTKHITDRTGKAIQQHRQKRQQKKRQEKQRDAEASPTREDPAYSSHRSDDPTNPTQTEPPSPQERMRQKAVREYREQQTADTPTHDRSGHAPRYDTSRPVMEQPKENRFLKNQSINQSIKERPRRSFSPKEKPSGGAFMPKTRQSVEQTARKAETPTRKAPSAKAAIERARKRSQREAQRKLLQRSQKAAQRTAELSKRAAIATVKAVKGMVSGLAALVGGGALLIALCVVLLFGAVMASPFGILFANEPSKDAVPLNAAISQLNMELTDKLANLQDGDYDGIDIQGEAPDWREVVAVFAAKTAGAEDGVDVAALTPDRVERLRAVFWDMCAVTSEVELIDHPATGTTEAWTETILHITITAKTADEMRTAYHFTDFQNQALTELLEELDALDGLLGDLNISQETALALYQNLPADLSAERKAVIKAACSLVGKVNYFWGGKSSTIGWDSRWGTLQKVTAEGSPTTGTYRPYGLDCSGMVDWVFNNAHSYVIGHGGGAHAQHTYCTAISWADAQPGDLVFYPEDTHVGIVGGWDEDGNLLIIHCASGYNNVVITGREGFTSIARPNYYTS